MSKNDLKSRGITWNEFSSWKAYFNNQGDTEILSAGFSYAMSFLNRRAEIENKWIKVGGKPVREIQKEAPINVVPQPLQNGDYKGYSKAAYVTSCLSASTDPFVTLDQGEKLINKYGCVMEGALTGADGNPIVRSCSGVFTEETTSDFAGFLEKGEIYKDGANKIIKCQ